MRNRKKHDRVAKHCLLPLLSVQRTLFQLFLRVFLPGAAQCVKLEAGLHQLRNSHRKLHMQNRYRRLACSATTEKIQEGFKGKKSNYYLTRKTV